MIELNTSSLIIQQTMPARFKRAAKRPPRIDCENNNRNYSLDPSINELNDPESGLAVCLLRIMQAH